jgi:hypothetical protein
VTLDEILAALTAVADVVKLIAARAKTDAEVRAALEAAIAAWKPLPRPS